MTRRWIATITNDRGRVTTRTYLGDEDVIEDGEQLSLYVGGCLPMLLIVVMLIVAVVK